MPKFWEISKSFKYQESNQKQLSSDTSNYVVFAKENYNCTSYICLTKFGHMRRSKSDIDLY